MTLDKTDIERMQIAIDFIKDQPRDTQLLEDYNEMITDILTLLLHSCISVNATQVAAESLFMLGYNASGTAK